MNSRRLSNGIAAYRRMTWPLFCGVSALGLGVCVIAALATGGLAHVALAFWIGLSVVTIAALVKYSIGTPPASTGNEQQPPFQAGGYVGTFFGGG